MGKELEDSLINKKIMQKMLRNFYNDSRLEVCINQARLSVQMYLKFFMYKLFYF